MLNVNANLFRIAAMAQSSEQTRYYLCGVYVEPRHEGGVTMTATDGRYLVSIFDETGSCEKPVIVQLPRHTLKSCRPAKKDLDPRRLVMSDLGNAVVRLSGTDVCAASKCIVDGTFPDWRSIVKSAMAPLLGTGSTPMFNQECYRVFCDIARALADSIKCGFMIEGARAGSAALVRFNGADHAFGLLMPMITDVRPELPRWFASTEETQQAA